jgi:hypothetical protein
MKPSEVASALMTCISVKQPVCAWGSPGIGKSQIIHQVGAALGLFVQDVRAVLLDPVDLRGLPHVNGDNRAHWAIPDFLPRDGKGILFLDELNRAPMLVQNACFQLVLDRKLGEYTLPDEWVVVSACNRESDGGGVSKMSSALCNRFVHLDVEPDLNDWCKWAVANGIEPMVIAFLRYRPNLLHQFSRTEKAFPSPRSWEFVSLITGKNANPDVEHGLFCGTVGNGAAAEYSAFIRLYKSIPSIDGILLNPQSAVVPTDPAGLYAVSSALAHRANAANFRQVMTYLDRIPEEYQVMTVKDATVRDPGLCSCTDFTSWAIKHADVVL